MACHWTGARHYLNYLHDENQRHFKCTQRVGGRGGGGVGGYNPGTLPGFSVTVSLAWFHFSMSGKAGDCPRCQCSQPIWLHVRSSMWMCKLKAWISKHGSGAWVSNYIPHDIMGCNYLFMPMDRMESIPDVSVHAHQVTCRGYSAKRALSLRMAGRALFAGYPPCIAKMYDIKVLTHWKFEWNFT